MSLGAKKLVWSDVEGIAAQLSARYPEHDRTRIDHAYLENLIRSLDVFCDVTSPSLRQLDHILWTWMRLAHPPYEATG